MCVLLFLDVNYSEPFLSFPFFHVRKKQPKIQVPSNSGAQHSVPSNSWLDNTHVESAEALI